MKPCVNGVSVNTSVTLKTARIDSELKSLPKAKAAFIEPMLLLRTDTPPEGAEWLYELKLDGYRALAIKTAARACRYNRDQQTD